MSLRIIDCNYVQNEFACSYLWIQNGKALFVECNTNFAIPALQKAVRDSGLKDQDVEVLILTHIHLDHAGGAGLFLKTFPNAKIWCHPRAARHAIDPTKLIAGATAVYGTDWMSKLYGEILPCDRDRVIEVQDQEVREWQNLKFEIKHTRGHANHHICIYESSMDVVFSGDSFGVSYPQIKRKGKFVVTPSTSPTDFHYDEAIKTLDWVMSKKPSKVGLTHYGFLEGEEIGIAKSMLSDQLRFAEDLRMRTKRESLNVDQAHAHLCDWTIDYFSKKAIALDEKDLQILDVDLKVNAQGIHWASQFE